MPAWVWLVVLLVVLGGMLAVAKALGLIQPGPGRSIAGSSDEGGSAGSKSPVWPAPFHVVESLLSPQEREFYEALRRAVPEQTLAFAKVRVADVLHLPPNATRRQSWLNRVQSKHFDFVLCDAKSLAPRAAIELDDSSHKRANRADRDAFLDQLCQGVGLPLIRFPGARAFDSRMIHSRLAEHLPSHPPASTTTHTPLRSA